MLSILVASFVIACCVTTSVLVMLVLRAETAKRRAADEVILASEPLLPEWIGQRRMDVPKKFGLIRTRNTKALR